MGDVLVLVMEKWGIWNLEWRILNRGGGLGWALFFCLLGVPRPGVYGSTYCDIGFYGVDWH